METAVLQPYINLLPTLLAGFVITIFLTPIVGWIAKRFQFVDLPKDKRKRTDKTLAQRIHTIPKLRLGGIAVFVTFIGLILLQGRLNPQILGMLAGLVVLLIAGAIDDKYELSARNQMIAQIIAALIVVLSGVTITQLDFAGQRFVFDGFRQIFDLGIFQYEFIFPGAFITVFWILLLINAINWMCGIDAIGEVMTFIASFTSMLLAVRADQYELAMISGIFAFNLLGYIPFNFPPSKIISGTAGTTGYGYILAVLAILSGSKITSAIMVLSLPLIDMIWVVIYRLIKLKDVTFFKRPFVGGNIHLHHRIMALGFSQIQTLFIEIAIISSVSLIAFYFGGFSNEFMIVITISVILLGIFTFITIKNGRRKPIEPPKTDAPPPLSQDEPTPEEKYAY